MDSRSKADLLQDLCFGIEELRKPRKCLIYPACPGGQPKKEHLVPCFRLAEVLVNAPQPRIRQALSQQSEPFAAASFDNCCDQQPVQSALRVTCTKLFHQRLGVRISTIGPQREPAIIDHLQHFRQM